MAWTVPSGCYYANYTSSNVWQYWGAGQSVPDANAPINISITSVSPSWLLVDFTNGYIYGTTARATINITASNTFTITDSGGWWSNMVRVYASDSALTAYTNYTITLTGTAFVFGDGSGLRNKFFHSSWKYSFFRAFANRTDIVSVTIPNGVDELIQAFQYCTNLQTATGTVANKSNCEAAFRGCTSLVTVTTFQNVGSMASCFYGCTALVTAPTIPEGVTNIANCFNRCSSLTTVPALPSTITAMQGAFMYCTALTTAPTIPNAVTNMQQCFNGCTSLVTASTIPASVTNTKWCFYDCEELTGAMTIDASPTDITEMFTGTVKEIVLFGTGGMNETLVAEYTNLYFWALSSTITAQRATSPTTTVNISVDVSRFNSGTLSSLELYRGTSTTPLSVTWSDPTLTITGTDATFTTTLTNIGESETFTLTVIATDTYGSSQASSVKIPVSFYTMDVQAGGKEIAFGSLADDDVTLHPNGLFKCAMDAYFEGDVVISGGGIGGTSTPTADATSAFDSDAHMNSTDMTTGADSELEDFIDSLNVCSAGQVVVVDEQRKFESSSTGTTTFINCTGTVSHNQIFFMKLASGIWCIQGRLNINNFTRSGANPGVTIALPSNVPTPTQTRTFICGFRSQSAREGVVLGLTANSRNATLTTHESFANAANGMLTFIVNSIFTLD